MEFWYWLLILFILTHEPLYGYIDYQRFKLKVKSNPGARASYYKKVMAGLWIPTVVILALSAFGSLTLQDIGLKSMEVDTESLGPWVTYIVFALGILYFISLLYFLIGSKVSQKMKNNIVSMKKSEMEKIQFIDIMPVSKEDKSLWTYVSWTAGVTEEIIYRGFLIFALGELLPFLSVWTIMIISSILFGLAHTYQGGGNVLRTSLLGLFFSVLYIGLGSILPLILFHFLIDYIAKIGEEE